MPFDINKCHILQVSIRNRKFDYEMITTKLESVQCVKDLNVAIALSLRFSQECKDAAGKDDRLLGFINRIFPYK